MAMMVMIMMSVCRRGRFVAVTHGEDERVMPGHALAMQTDKPFRSLQQVRSTNQIGRVVCFCQYQGPPPNLVDLFASCGIQLI